MIYVLNQNDLDNVKHIDARCNVNNTHFSSPFWQTRERPEGAILETFLSFQTFDQRHDLTKNTCLPTYLPTNLPAYLPASECIFQSVFFPKCIFGCRLPHLLRVIIHLHISPLRFWHIYPLWMNLLPPMFDPFTPPPDLTHYPPFFVFFRDHILSVFHEQWRSKEL